MAQDSFQITRELGSSEMKIDLAVRDTNNENDYVCGVVLDGPAYYESEYTLERDCLRQKVLRSHGWNLIQVWTVDFLADPEAAYLVLKSKIDAAMAAA
jgi:very-short-patch-repair endonuclease